ncbi:MAG: putative bifunctional diguanylate cyclase/phosphodiesterase, partial [Pyrinomonadaceae bacterium]
VFGTSILVTAVFGSPQIVVAQNEFSSLVLLVGLLALSMFAINSILIAILSSLIHGKRFLAVWRNNCYDTIIIYLMGAVVAGVSIEALTVGNVSIYVLAVAVGIFAAIFFTFRRFVNDVKGSAAEIQNIERKRAEQAERHLAELENYVTQLEESGEALRESREKFKYAAFHDALTDLPNRNKFIEVIDEMIAAGETNFAFLFLDLNGFKTINESLGYSIGDKLLQTVAARIAGVIETTCLFGRFGGDEFAVLIPSITADSHAPAVSKRIVACISQPFILGPHNVFTGASVGIAFGNEKYSRAEEILRDADIAMYQAKDKQKPYVIFDPEMHENAVRRMEIETDLRLAVERKEFELFYQPIVGMSDLSLCGFEALVRWNHPKRGLVSPADFIPIAETTGLVIPMTIDILRTGCMQLVEWERRLERPGLLMLSVNLSVTHFADPALVDQIKEIMKESGISPSSLKLEITESAVMENAESAIAMLQRIKAAGVSISIDDFGTGYSSLSYLHKFPLDYLKIDRSFVSAMDDGTENREIVRTIIALAKALKLSIIAEGIETKEQLQKLRTLGCEFGQGYLFSRPLPVSEIDGLLNDDNHWKDLGDFGDMTAQVNANAPIELITMQ